MKKMESVITVRLPEEDVKLIKEFSAAYKKDKSTAVRELVEMGRVYFAIREYKDEKISLGRAAKIAGLTLSGMMDLLSNLGIKNHISLDEYLLSKKTAEKLF
ncbi:MAG: UPF0175 family protein [Candidatus Nanoarchaeia archaeon]